MPDTSLDLRATRSDLALDLSRVNSARRLTLSLPTIHCAGCISKIERDLTQVAGVLSARVNLTLKRVQVEACDALTAESLIAALNSRGFEAHELDEGTLASSATDRTSRELLTRLAVAGFAMMNIMLLSVAVWSGASDATRNLFHWIAAAIALPTIAYSAQPFFRTAWQALSAFRLNMDVPISLAILLAGGLSIFETAQGGPHVYFDAAVSLTFFLLAGRYLDNRTRSAARSAARELTALEVSRAVRLTASGDEIVVVSELCVGDLVRVRPGVRVPVDGVITDGKSELDRSLLTGESLPVSAEAGMAVSAGEINLTGPLTVRVTAAGEDTSLRRMAALVALAETARNRYTSLADRAAAIYAPAVHLLALAAFVSWLAISGGDVRLALNIAVAVLIITCPCALGLAVPAVNTAASGRLFRKGFLIKSATALERLAEVDTVVFDKTGTLTDGTPELANPCDHGRSDLEIALALAVASSHPLATSLATALRSRGVEPALLTDPREVPGQGIEAALRGVRVRLGRAGWTGATPRSETATYLAVGDEPPLAFTFTDRLRPGAEEAVRSLKEAGMNVILLSGDTAPAVADIAARTGIETWHAGVLPHEKASQVAFMAADGRRVLMIGDGLNDTAALATAHVSISPASALDASRVASDIVLLGRDLRPLVDAARVARSATRRIRENFAIAVLYNCVAIPVALVGLATPLVAALAMSASSITVSLNALRLR